MCRRRGRVRRGTGTTDQCLEKDGEQRRQALRESESGEGEPAASAQEEQSDERERDGAAESSSKPVEDERQVGEQRPLDVAHRLRPAAVCAERSCRYEDGDQDDEREHSAGCPKSMSRLREKGLIRDSRWPVAPGCGPSGRLHVHVRYMCVLGGVFGISRSIAGFGLCNLQTPYNDGG